MTEKPPSTDLEPPVTLTADQIAKHDKKDIEQFLNMQRQLKEKLDQANSVIEDQFQRLKDQETKIKTFAQMEKDQKWKNLEKKLPKGLITGPESQYTREWLNNDPDLHHILQTSESPNNEPARLPDKAFPDTAALGSTG